MKRNHNSEIEPPAKLKQSPAQRHTPPKERKPLKNFISNASDKEMQDADFNVNHLLTLLSTGTVATIEKILKFHPELVNQYGRKQTPLMAVLRQTRQDNSFPLKSVQQLLHYGANPFLVENETCEDALTPMEFITQKISNVAKNSNFYKKFLKCRELFEDYAKNFESQARQENVSQIVDPHAMLKIQDVNKSELTQYFENSLDDSESPLVLPNPKLKPPTQRTELKNFILNASNKEMQDANFRVDHLLSMIYSGTVATVEKILTFHSELVNQYGSSGRTPLMTALRQTKGSSFSLTLVETLLHYGANPFLTEHATNGYSLTPMEFITKNISNLDACVSEKIYKIHAKCRELFEQYAGNFELQTRQENIFDLDQTHNAQVMLGRQDFNELELTQHYNDLFNQSEFTLSGLDSLEREQFSEKKLAPEKLNQPHARRQPPTDRNMLKQFILSASEKEMQDTNFKVEHLISMIHSGTVVIVEKVLKFHPKLINQHGRSGKTPLMTALCQKRAGFGRLFYLELINILMQYGANPFLRDIVQADGAPLTPMELVMQLMQNPDCSKVGLKKCQRCKELFEAYEKKDELAIREKNNSNFNQPPRRAQQHLGELELMQYLGDLLDQAEMILPASASSEQDQFYENNQETDFFTAFSSLISDNSKTIESKNKLTASTDFLDVLPALTSFEESQVFEKNVEMDLFTASPSLMMSDNKTTESKNELTASTDFFERVKARQRLI